MARLNPTMRSIERVLAEAYPGRWRMLFAVISRWFWWEEADPPRTKLCALCRRASRQTRWMLALSP